MKKLVKKLVLQIKVRQIEVLEDKLPKTNQTYNENIKYKGKVLSVKRLEDTQRTIDQNNIKGTLDKIRQSKDFQEFFKRSNSHSMIDHFNIFQTYYQAFPEDILKIARFPIETQFFSNILYYLQDKKNFFHSSQLDLNSLKSFSETFLEALKEDNLSLDSFNFLDLKFSTIPNEKFSKLLLLTSCHLNHGNEANANEQILLMIKYDRKDKLTELLNRKFMSHIFLQMLLRNETIPIKYKGLLMKFLRRTK